MKIVINSIRIEITKNRLKKIQLINQNISRNQALFKWKNIWQLSYTCFRVFGASGQFGGNRAQMPQMDWDT